MNSSVFISFVRMTLLRIAILIAIGTVAISATAQEIISISYSDNYVKNSPMP